MIILAKIGIGLLGTAVVGGAMLSSEGFIVVRVHEKQAHGSNVSLLVPAAIVPIALEFIPNRNLQEASANLQPYLPMIDTAIPALQHCADGVLVEVSDPKEHVMISKAGDSIVVDVRDPNETVHVAVPLRVARSAIHEIAAASAGPI